jgi:hypothetical protein
VSKSNSRRLLFTSGMVPALVSLVAFAAGTYLQRTRRPTEQPGAKRTVPSESLSPLISQNTKQITATRSSRVAPTVTGQPAQIAGAVSESEGVDPDLPRFMSGEVDREDYLRRREAWLNRRRGLHPGAQFDPAARGRAIQKMELQEGLSGTRNKRFAQESFNSPNTATWSSMGPAPIPNGQTQNLVKPVSGRVTSIAINPSNTNIVYVGTAQGGVYRTLDGGATWTSLMDNAASLVIGSVAIAPSQPSTVYVGTGEGNFSCDSFTGVGVYRIDNADSASPIITGPLNKDASNSDIFTGWSIAKIVVHPTNPDIIFLGVIRGVGGSQCDADTFFIRSAVPPGLFRSINATSPSPTFSKLTIADLDFDSSEGVTDIEFEPGNPNNLLVGVKSFIGSGVYRTTNSLEAIPTFTLTLDVFAEVRVEIAINKVGNQVTVFAATGEQMVFRGPGGTLYRSTDGGETWSGAGGTNGFLGFCDAQCIYDMPIAIDPTDANIVYLGGSGSYGGNAHILTQVLNALGTPVFTPMEDGLHPDEHAIEIDPTNSNIIWTGNDGGIFKSTDGAVSWVSMNNRGFSATQFESIAIHPTDRYFTLGGTQDNGTEFLKPDNMWTLADSGDGGYALIDQNATDTTNVTMYHVLPFGGPGLGFARLTNTAQAHDFGWTYIDLLSLGGGDATVDFYPPMALGPGNPNTVYFGSDRLWRSSDRGNTMAVVSQGPIDMGAPITAIAISPQNDNVRIVGSTFGRVFRTTTGSSTLDMVFAIPTKSIGTIKIDPNHQNTAYVTMTEYFGNSTAHIYRTTNLSDAVPTWTGIDSGQIPDIPVNALAIDPANSNNLYAGTDIGVYRSTDGGATWIPFSNGLPRVSVFDMAIQNSSRILRIATHGRGIWEISIDTNPSTLKGIISDRFTAAKICGATVSVGNRSTTTDGTGFYQFTDLPSGSYDVVVSAGGYCSSCRFTDIFVPAGSTDIFDIDLVPSPNGGCLTDTSQSDFQAATATDNVDFASSPGDLKLALTPSASLDQINTFDSGFLVSPAIGGNNWYAQTFTAGTNGRLMRVDVVLSTASGGIPGTVTVEIRNTSGSNPGGTILASATVGVFTDPTTFFYYPAQFASPPTVTIGTKYAIVIHSNSGGAFQTLLKGSDSYSGGFVLRSTNGGTAWTMLGNDMWFRTYVAPSLFLASGTLTSSVKDAFPAVGFRPQWITLSWTANAPSGSFAPLFQVAGSNSPNGPFNFVGPDGTASTYFGTSVASLSQFNGNRYLMYKAYLSTFSNFKTPTLSDVTVCFSNVSCTFTLNSTSQSFAAEGGTNNVSVTCVSGCTWNAISNDAWITITSGINGTGSSVVNYSVAPNNTGNPRNGTMTIAGQTFTVNQSDIPTAVTLESLTAAAYNNGVFVEWKTGFEVQNLGFHIYREQNGQRTRITPEIVAGSALIAGDKTKLTAGQSYGWWDSFEDEKWDSPNLSYWLEDIDLDGTRTMHGPITPKIIRGPAPQSNAAALLSNIGKGQPRIGQVVAEHGSRVVSQDVRTTETSQMQRDIQWELASRPAIKLSIKEEGWYRVTQPELIAAGLDPKTDPRSLQLFVQGSEQAILVTGEQDGSFDREDAIEFYATGQEVPFTDAHTYWLVNGKQPGKRINIINSPAKSSGAPSFSYTIERKEKTIYFASLQNADAENFFGPVITSLPVEQNINIQHLDTTARDAAVLEIALQGVTDSPGAVDHQVRITLNGTQLSRMIFDARQHPIERLTLPAGLLKEGDNLVTLAAEGGPSDISLVDYVRITYRHKYTADQDSLRMTTTEASQSIDGFSNAPIRVVDITDMNEPEQLIGQVDAQKDGTFGVTVQVPANAPRSLVAFTEDRIKHPFSITANQPSSWHDRNHSADLLIISHRDFAGSAALLKALRQKQGYAVEIIDVEDIYDEFSFGEKSPQALKDLFAHARATWKIVPRYILFVGDASYDPRNYLGAGDFDFVPTKLIDTTYLETASDDWFVDFNDDGLPEMYVGRLPVRTPAEATAVVGKIINYDSNIGKTQAPSSSVLLVADKNDGFNFEQTSEQLRALIPAGTNVEEIFRSRLDDASAKKQLIASINAGKSIVNYSGHGSANVWRSLFTTTDIPSLENRQKLPLFITMTCLNGFIQDPISESLAEGLHKSERGGAIAVWSSSGLTLPAQQALINQQLYRLMFAPRDPKASPPTLGEMTSKAKSATNDLDVRRTWMLLGDPTMRLK